MVIREGIFRGSPDGYKALIIYGEVGYNLKGFSGEDSIEEFVKHGGWPIFEDDPEVKYSLDNKNLIHSKEMIEW